MGLPVKLAVLIGGCPQIDFTCGGCNRQLH